jgi:hypothetical protein
MAISSISLSPPASSPVNSVVSHAAAPFVEGAKSGAEKVPSTVVTLSAQGQKLSQSHAQTSTSQTNQAQTSSRTDTATAERVESVPKEANEPPGIQFMEGETKGGRISTFA